MTAGIASLILNAGEGETLFQASGEFWILRERLSAFQQDRDMLGAISG